MDCLEIEICRPNLNPRRAPVGFVMYKMEDSIFSKYFTSSAICPSADVPHVYSLIYHPCYVVYK